MTKEDPSVQNTPFTSASEAQQHGESGVAATVKPFSLRISVDLRVSECCYRKPILLLVLDRNSGLLILVGVACSVHNAETLHYSHVGTLEKLYQFLRSIQENKTQMEGYFGCRFVRRSSISHFRPSGRDSPT